MASLTLQTIKEVSQIINYLALSVSGPLAVIGYLRAKQREQAERQYRIYDELDNKLLEFQKIALAHDLDLLDVPDYHPYLTGDSVRKKHNLVASGLGFALFQRAFLMFHDQPDDFKRQQWRGWEQLLMRFLARLPVRDAWQLSKERYDVSFQNYINDKLVESMSADGTDPAVIRAFIATGMFIRDDTEHLFDEPTLRIWRAALDEHRDAA
jgi:hypothetical protein